MERTLPSSFYEACNTLVPIPNKDSTRKLQTDIPHEYRCKNLYQNVGKLNSAIYTKKVHTMTMGGLLQRYKASLLFKNQCFL